VTIVLPFHGSRSEAADALSRLAGIKRQPGDRALLVDNTDDGVAAGIETTDGVEVLVSPVKRSAYGARNVGAAAATTEWVLFVDADCRFAVGLLDAYFEPAPGERVGALGGRVEGTPGQTGLAPEWTRSRRLLSNETTVDQHEHRPMAVTANLLVLREAWAAVGGFAERTRSGADADFCWRLADAGWSLEYRHDAHVLHDHRPTLRALLSQSRRDGAGATWLARRHPGFDGLMHGRDFARAAVGALAWPLLGQPRRGLYKAIDGAWGLAARVGAACDTNATNAPAESDAGLVVVVDEWPRSGEPLVAALGGRGAVRVEARRRASAPDWPAARAVPATFWEDDSPVERLRRPRGELGPPARRLARSRPDVVVAAAPEMTGAAQRLTALAGRADAVVRSFEPARPATLPGGA
jgi:GT2 family glycosyltransferase